MSVDHQPIQDSSSALAFELSKNDAYLGAERIDYQMDMIRHYYVADEFEWMNDPNLDKRFDKEPADRAISKYRYSIERHCRDVMKRVGVRRFEKFHKMAGKPASKRG